jgi:uncharacterized Tic20 family protein
MTEANEKQEMEKPPEKPEAQQTPTAKPRMDEKQERMWGMLCHLVSFAGYITGIGFIIGPLIVWLIKREESPFVDYHGKESLNFQISMFIYWIVSGILTVIVIGFVLMLALVVFHIIMVIMASMKANAGEKYRYPLTIRFLK